jgi:uncharacterized protein with FMN-binding domain
MGGPVHDGQGRILDTLGQPIPHLYSAGEMGSIFSDHYQGSGNLGECISFGRISGQNAAADKNDTFSGSLLTDGRVPFQPAPSGAAPVVLATGEYLGEARGMGGPLAVKVTRSGAVITAVEIVSHHETPGISDRAIATLPEAIVRANSVNVDSISGATVTSRAIKEAVTAALTAE